MIDLDRNRELVRKMKRADPDLNLYLLAYDCPELEEAALTVAREQTPSNPEL